VSKVNLRKLKRGPQWPSCPCCRTYKWRPKERQLSRELLRAKERQIAKELVQEEFALMELEAREVLEEDRKRMQEYLDDLAYMEFYRAMDLEFSMDGMEYRLDQAKGLLDRG